MGNKVWSEEERDFFLKVIIPHSHYATGTLNKVDGRMSFVELIPVMQHAMREIGETREYSKGVMFQHYYQWKDRMRKQKRSVRWEIGPPTAAQRRQIQEWRTDIAAGVYGSVENEAEDPGEEIPDDEEDDGGDDYDDYGNDDQDNAPIGRMPSNNTLSMTPASMHDRYTNPSMHGLSLQDYYTHGPRVGGPSMASPYNTGGHTNTPLRMDPFTNSHQARINPTHFGSPQMIPPSRSDPSMNSPRGNMSTPRFENPRVPPPQTSTRPASRSTSLAPLTFPNEFMRDHFTSNSDAQPRNNDRRLNSPGMVSPHTSTAPTGRRESVNDYAPAPAPRRVPPQENNYFTTIMNQRRLGVYHDEDDDEFEEEEELPDLPVHASDYPRPRFEVPSRFHPNSSSPQIPLFKSSNLKKSGATLKKPAPKKTPAKKTPAKKTPAKKTPAKKKTPVSKKAPVKKSTAKKIRFVGIQNSSSDDESEEEAVNPKWVGTKGRSSSPVGIPRFDIQREATRPLKKAKKYKVGSGAGSKPWAMSDEDEDEEVDDELDWGEGDNRPFFNDGKDFGGGDEDEGGAGGVVA